MQVHQKDKERMEEAKQKPIDIMMEELQRERVRALIELRLQVLVNRRSMKQRAKIQLLKPGKQMEHEQKEENQPREPSVSPFIIVIGGRSPDRRNLKSVEGYIIREGRWITLPEMNIPRAFHSAVVVGHVIIVSGGDVGDSITDTIEVLDLDETPRQWKISDARLPVPLSGHQTVVYKGNLVIIGGYDNDEGMVSKKIYKIPLIPPYTLQELRSLLKPTA